MSFIADMYDLNTTQQFGIILKEILKTHYIRIQSPKSNDHATLFLTPWNLCMF